MTDSTFVYVTYIRTSADQLWQALLQPEFTRAYWFGFTLDSDWKPGSPWRMLKPDGSPADAGEVLESDPPRRLKLSWRNEFRPELTAEGFSECSFELEPMGEMVKLTVTHRMDKPQSKMIQAVSGGWPQILASLKSLLETGTALQRPAA